MAECSECGDSISMPFTCKFCGGKFCSKHRLPENHDCGGLEEYKADKKKKDREITYDAQREEEEHRKERGNRPVSMIQRTWRSLKDSVRQLFGGSPTRQSPVGRSGRRGPAGPRRSAFRESFPDIATFLLLGAIFLVFILEIARPAYMLKHFALNPLAQEGVRTLSFFGQTMTISMDLSVLQQPWTVLTSIFMHVGTGHLLINAMVLYFFGSELERRVGTPMFLQIFFIAGLAGSLGFIGYVYMTGVPQAAMGASGALYGVFATLAVIAPEIRVLAFFVIPLSIRKALIGFALLDIFLLTQGGSLIASAAHLAGAVAGIYYGFRLKKRYGNQPTYDMLSI